MKDAAPHCATGTEAFAALGEATALAALAGVAGDGAADPAVYQPLVQWLQDTPQVPLARIRDGFQLSEPATALVTVLFAATRSEAVARAIAGLVQADDRVPVVDLPVWLARRAVPGLGVAELATGAALCRFGFVVTPGGSAHVGANLRLCPAIADRLGGQVPEVPELSSWTAPMPLPEPGAVQDDPGGLTRTLGRGLAMRGPAGLPPLLLAPDLHPEDLCRAIAALGLAPWRARLSDVPTDPASRDLVAAVWSREAALDGSVLIVDAHRTDAAGLEAMAGLADRIVGHVVLCGTQRIPPVMRGQYVVSPDGDAPSLARMRWSAALGAQRAARIGVGLGRIASQFRLDAEGLAAATLAAGPQIDGAPDAETACAALWHAAARAVPAADLPGVSVGEPGFGWEDLILPPATEAVLRRIETHVRHSARVFDDWGFAARAGGTGTWRGRGVAVLFAGPSGTGKTMAAGVLASALDLRLMVLDLSQIISKYIGETAKNIAAAFAEAERLGCVMVWNEGDAIWGARGGVSSATDRHVNAEVGDLLQRIEAFSGFTVVTTNLRHAIDPAFLRRFRFIVDFPVPSAQERLRLWQDAFPAATPVDPIDWRALVTLPLTGGAIRNIALGAAFRAADRESAVSREMVFAELAEELRKQNLPVPNIDWEVPE